MKSYIVKLKSKLGKLPEFDDYKELMDENQLDSKLEYINKLYPKKLNADSIEDMELQLKKMLYDEIQSITYFLSGKDKEFFLRYVSKLEIEALQNIIQAILNHSLDRNINNLEKDPFSKKFNINVDMNYDDFVSTLKNTRYHRTLVPFSRENMPEDSMIFLISNSLIKFYFRDLFDYIGKFPSNVKEELDDYLGKEVDLYNIKMIYRLKKYFKLNDYEIFNYLIEGGSYIRTDKLKELIGMSLDEFIEYIKTTKYRSIFSGEHSFGISMIIEKYKWMKRLQRSENPILFMIYGINKIYYSMETLISTLEIDDSFTQKEKEEYIIVR